MTLLSAQAGIELPDPVDDTVASALLEYGEIDVIGRMPWSSNATFLVSVSPSGREPQATDGPDVPPDAAILAIYKPQAGERPLWDFPDGTLAAREVAAYAVSELLGWGLVPHTVLRDGPVGVGALSQFHDHDPEQHYFEIVNGREDVFRRFAAFDAIINNTDRKGGHVLLDEHGHVWGIDHGTCFHVHPKLRTVIWEFAGEPIADRLLTDLECLVDRIAGGGAHSLRPLLMRAEIDATLDRARSLLRRKRFALPSGDYHDYPWPTI
ncbi:MAG TPA: SCO1664 family protein [Acidimicrobiia bacterium]